VHLVGFIISIYHDARSPERQIRSKPVNYSSMRKAHSKTRDWKEAADDDDDDDDDDDGFGYHQKLGIP